MNQVDMVAPEALRARAVNTIVNDGGRLGGFNTDIPAIRAAIEEGGVAPKSAHAVILGAGGSAKAAATALEGAQITLASRRPRDADAPGRAAVWAVVGGAAGLGIRWASVKLAHLEGLESGHKWWQVYGPPVLCAAVFAVYGYEISSFLLLLVRSLFVLVLVQVIFFDFEHHLILDRVMFPAMAVAVLVGLSALFPHNPPGLWPQGGWWGIAMGLGAGGLFLGL